MLAAMIKNAVLQGIRFDYLLTDSRLTNFEPAELIAALPVKCHFTGMLKRGKTQYPYKGRLLNFSKKLNSLKRSWMKYPKKLNCHSYEAAVDFKGIAVKLFFCRTGKRGSWHGLLTANTKLTFEKAFEICATRWTVEVFFRECKQYLRSGKCESPDFDAQIAAAALSMLPYSLFSTVKRFESYESFGALFRAAKPETPELNVKEGIWLIIKEILTVLSNCFEIDIEFLAKHIIADNKQLTNILNLNSLASGA
jgi:hypothetical protein